MPDLVSRLLTLASAFPRSKPGMATIIDETGGIHYKTGESRTRDSPSRSTFTAQQRCGSESRGPAQSSIPPKRRRPWVQRRDLASLDGDRKSSNYRDTCATLHPVYEKTHNFGGAHIVFPFAFCSRCHASRRRGHKGEIQSGRDTGGNRQSPCPTGEKAGGPDNCSERGL